MGVHCNSPEEKSQMFELGEWRGDREKQTNAKDPVQQAFDIHKGSVLATPNLMSTAVSTERPGFFPHNLTSAFPLETPIPCLSKYHKLNT